MCIRDSYKKCYIWVLVNKARKTAIFFYENGSRGHDVLTDFLGDAELKSIMSDGYNAYVFIGNELKSCLLYTSYIFLLFLLILMLYMDFLHQSVP